MITNFNFLKILFYHNATFLDLSGFKYEIVSGSDTAEGSLEEPSRATASPVGDQAAGVELPNE